MAERELQARLEDAIQANQQLWQEVERKERERRAPEVNLRDVLGNLRHAAQEAGNSRVVARAPEEATLVPPRPSDDGW
jgi:hypothetical protein